MRHRLLLTLGLVILAWLLVPLTFAQVTEPVPQTCEERECPAPSPTAWPRSTARSSDTFPTQQPTATQQPTPSPTTGTGSGNVPTPSGICATNAPAAAEGSQAWMTDATPPYRSNTTLCVRLIVLGQALSGIPVTANAFYPASQMTYQGSTDNTGVASLLIDTTATNIGSVVRITTQANYNGQIYTAETSFTAR